MVKLSNAQPASLSTADQIERDMARSALEKRQRGEKPSATELSALRRFEAAREEEQRWAYYSSIPKKHWREMSGRAAQIINDQADRYGLPLRGRTIDLPAFVRAVHEFLARNAKKLAGADDEDPLLAGVSSPALERYRDERAKLAKLDRLEREGSLIPRADIHEGLAIFANILRGAGETLQRQFGPEAHAILDEALEDAVREVVSRCPDYDERDRADTTVR